MGRADLCRFGYRPDPRNNAKLFPEKEEQATIRRAQHLREGTMGKFKSHADRRPAMIPVVRRMRREGKSALEITYHEEPPRETVTWIPLDVGLRLMERGIIRL